MYDNYPDNAYSWMPTDFGWKLTLFLIGAAVIIFLVNLFLRKLLGIEKRNFLIVGHVNDKHKKGDFYLNIAGAIVLVAAFAYGYEHGPVYPLYASLAIALMSTLYRAYMEKKYAENPKDYLCSLLEFPLIILLVLSLGSFLFPDMPFY